MINLLPDYALQNYITSYSVEERRQAHALWRSNTAYSGLLDNYKRYAYDRDPMLYFDRRTHRYISASQIGIDVLRFSQAMRDKQRAITQQAINGRINNQQWYDESLRLMKLSYHASVDVANGREEDSNDELLLLLLLLFFNRFQNLARQVSMGEILLDRSIMSRINLYGLNARSVYENQRLQNARLSGFTECKRSPGPSEHCQNGNRPGCDELIAKGWMPIAQMVPIGQTTCLSNCQCTLQFRNRVFGIFSSAVIQQHSLMSIYDNTGKLLFKYSPEDQRVEIKHKWHDKPVNVDLKRYKR